MGRHLLAAGLLSLATACASKPPIAPVASAARPAPPTSKQTTGLEGATDSIRIYERDTVDPENSMPTIGGYVRVHAPLDVALQVATEFDDYKDLNPQYIEQSTVVDKPGDSTDLYLRVPTVIHEYVWAVVRFKPVPTPTGYAYRGDEVKGNLDDLRIYWRIVPVHGPNGDDVIAQFEFLADPHLPIPRAWIVPEVREGVRIILDRYRNKAQARAGQFAQQAGDPVQAGEGSVDFDDDPLAAPPNAAPTD